MNIINQTITHQHWTLIPSFSFFHVIPLTLFLVTFFTLLITPQFVFADVFIPTQEYLGYFDHNGVYTVVGNVKNQNDYAVLPFISVSVVDNDEILTNTILHVPIPPNTDIPFKIKFPQVLGDHPLLLDPKLKFVKTDKSSVPIEILYDATLITHDDGHVTGRIHNTGNQTVFYPKVLAIAHGNQGILDVVNNIAYIDKIEPNEILEFSMYPDPSVTDNILYYSCFAPVDSTVVPITTYKNGGNFDFRYDSGAWYSAAKFNEDGTTLTIRGYNSYPLETFANFEFPQISGKEEFTVYLNDEPINFIQSMDEMGFWHVAFNVKPSSQGIIKIDGFEKGLPLQTSKIPKWIKTNANWWSTNQISDSEFLESIDFLLKKGIIYADTKKPTVDSDWKIPKWIKTIAQWWSEDELSDDEFLQIIQYLVKHEIIVV